MKLRRPKRKYYTNEPAWVEACSRYLDAEFPERQAYRYRLDPAAVVARMQSLLATDRPLTGAEEELWNALAAAYRASRRTQATGGSRR